MVRSGISAQLICAQERPYKLHTLVPVLWPTLALLNKASEIFMKFPKKTVISVVAAALLVACVNEPQTMTDVHTGVSAGASKR